MWQSNTVRSTKAVPMVAVQLCARRLRPPGPICSVKLIQKHIHLHLFTTHTILHKFIFLFYRFARGGFLALFRAEFAGVVAFWKSTTGKLSNNSYPLYVLYIVIAWMAAKSADNLLCAQAELSLWAPVENPCERRSQHPARKTKQICSSIQNRINEFN